MSVNRLEFQRNITNKLKNKTGSILFLGIFIFLLLVAMMFFNIDTSNRMLTHQFIEDTISECLSSTGADNLIESYQPHRDSNVGSYIYNGQEFTEIQNTSMFTRRLASDFDVTHKNGNITSYDEYEKIVFQLSDIKLYVNNTDATYLVTYNLTIPQKVNNYELYTYEKSQVVKYQTRF